MDMRFEIPAPRGFFSILIDEGDEQNKPQTNLVTELLFDTLTAGSAVEIANPVANTSLFAYCHLGSGVAELDHLSEGLTTPYVATSTLSDVRILTTNYSTSIGYTLQLTFSFPTGSIVGNISEIMLSNSSNNEGMLCGKTLINPKVATEESTVRVIYNMVFDNGQNSALFPNSFVNGETTVDTTVTLHTLNTTYTSGIDPTQGKNNKLVYRFIGSDVNLPNYFYIGGQPVNVTPTIVSLTNTKTDIFTRRCEFTISSRDNTSEVSSTNRLTLTDNSLFGGEVLEFTTSDYISKDPMETFNIEGVIELSWRIQS